MSTRKSIKSITCALISLKKNFSAHPENQVVIDFVLATGESSTKTDRARGTFETKINLAGFSGFFSLSGIFSRIPGKLNRNFCYLCGLENVQSNCIPSLQRLYKRISIIFYFSFSLRKLLVLFGGGTRDGSAP
jgi:hypothetical protein